MSFCWRKQSGGITGQEANVHPKLTPILAPGDPFPLTHLTPVPLVSWLFLRESPDLLIPQCLQLFIVLPSAQKYLPQRDHWITPLLSSSFCSHATFSVYFFVTTSYESTTFFLSWPKDIDFSQKHLLSTDELHTLKFCLVSRSL